jgi:hypothetical protein
MLKLIQITVARSAGLVGEIHEQIYIVYFSAQRPARTAPPIFHDQYVKQRVTRTVISFWESCFYQS